MKTEGNDIEQQFMEAEDERVIHRSSPASATRPSSTTDDEIDLGDLLRQIWNKRRIVWAATIITFIIGILVAIMSSEEYEASVVLMPQASDANNGVGAGFLRQLGGISGLGLGGASSSGTLSPNLYPEITRSTPFYLDIIEKDLYFPTLDSTINLTQYFIEVQQPNFLDYVKMYTIGLPGIIINLPAKVINAVKDKPVALPSLDKEKPTSADTLTNVNEPVRLTGRQRAAIGKMKGRITTSIEENSTVRISAEMPDPMVAAEATQMAASYLTNYILEYRTEKAQQDLVFVQNQYDEKKERYNASQRRLARFRDRNMNIISETALIEQQQLEAENQLAFGLYQSLAQQLEQAKIKVQEETPVFKVLEPIQVPSSKSKPNRELIIILSIFVGFFLGLGIVFLQILYGNVKHTLSTS